MLHREESVRHVLVVVGLEDIAHDFRRKRCLLDRYFPQVSDLWQRGEETVEVGVLVVVFVVEKTTTREDSPPTGRDPATNTVHRP